MNNIVLCGFMGAGKTVVGRELAKITGCRFIDTDALIEKEQGMAIKAIFAARGEAYFRDLEAELCKRLGNTKNSVIATGGGTLTFEENVNAIKSGGARVVFLDAGFEVICARVGDGASRPLFRDKENVRRLYDERRSAYLAAADMVVDGDMSARKTAMTIASMIR